MAGYDYGPEGGYGQDGGYGYVEYFPGGGLNASQELYGPGTTAYEAYGPYSSYARESERGGIFEQNVTDTQGYGHHGYLATATDYSYHGAGYSISSYTGTRLSDYGGYSYATGTYDTASYRATSDVTVDHGGMSTVHQYSTSYYTFADGTYAAESTSRSFDEVNGVYVQGSGTEASSSTYGYVGGYGGYPPPS